MAWIRPVFALIYSGGGGGLLILETRSFPQKIYLNVFQVDGTVDLPLVQ
jgi:hypothetical protein